MSIKRIRLASLILVALACCTIFALFFATNPLVQEVAGTVIVANALGAIAAYIVTYVLAFPRDGSLRNENPD